MKHFRQNCLLGVNPGALMWGYRYFKIARLGLPEKDMRLVLHESR